ncbi:hypothetical protein SDC9_72975 [bioreactor metagenome]|uniref:Uncharacterized protein n=1 Tax=bioreactor metagenome TaxID=1076179 RepID=A0A644YJ08_9ZZZZ
MGRCIYQIDRRLQRLRAADALEDGGHRIGVGQRVLPRLQVLAREQRNGKRAHPRKRANLLGRHIRRGGDQLRNRIGTGRSRIAARSVARANVQGCADGTCFHEFSDQVRCWSLLTICWC